MSQNRQKRTVWVKDTNSEWILAKNRIVAKERLCSNPNCAEIHKGFPRLISSEKLCRKEKKVNGKAFCDRDCRKDYDKCFVRAKHDESGRFAGVEALQNI